MKAKSYGRIINIISTSVKQPIPDLGVSNTIRGAVANWAKTLAVEVGRFGITVNNILPGFTDTARLRSLIKNIAQKTDAYQLSKALILNDAAEFDAKPELEIYADDVKCSHGSTSGSIDLNSIHYLKSRGIPEKEAYQMLINGFLCEILEKLSEGKIKNFLKEKLERQINGY